jgi:hypothetical protein
MIWVDSPSKDSYRMLEGFIISQKIYNEPNERMASYILTLYLSSAKLFFLYALKVNQIWLNSILHIFYINKNVTVRLCTIVTQNR